MRGIYLSVEIRTVLTCADALQEKLADRHLLRCHSMTAARMLKRSGMKLYLNRQGFFTQAPCRNRRQTATCRVQVMSTFNLIKSLSRRHLVRIMKERTRAFFFLRAFPCENKHIRVILKWRPSTKLIEEHAVLLAPVLILQNDVNAPVLSVGDRLPEERMCDF